MYLCITSSLIWFSTKELEDVLVMAEYYAWAGRPMLDKLLQEGVDRAKGKSPLPVSDPLLSFVLLVVLTRTHPCSFFIGCGPTSLSASIGRSSQLRSTLRRSRREI